MTKRRKPTEPVVTIHAVNPTTQIAMGHIPTDDGKEERYGVVIDMKSETGETVSVFHDTVGSAHVMMGAYMDAEKYLEIIDSESYELACIALEDDAADEAGKWDNLPWDEPQSE